MLSQTSREFRITTRGRGFYEFTDEIQHWIKQSGLKSGLLTLHLRHTSASLLIQENADPALRRDLEHFFSRLAPDSDPLFVHTVEGKAAMPAHVRTRSTAVSLSLPIRQA